MDISESPPMRGYAWFIYPDSTTVSADQPFGPDDPAPQPRPGLAKLPAGVTRSWTVNVPYQGILNTRQGHSYLALTDSPEPPPVAEGWTVEPARLQDDCQIDQRGDRWVRLRRILNTIASPRGELQEAEFEVVKG